MTEAQRHAFAYYEAMSIFDDDVDALATAVAGLLTRHDNMKFKGLISRDFRAGRYSKYYIQLTKVPDMTEEEIASVWFIRKLGFGELKGQLLETYTQMSDADNEINKYKAGVELKNIDECIKQLMRLKMLIADRTNVVPRAIDDIRQGSLF